ncbi:Putative disease resistance protein [Arachis hypogaea]|nr:Putative disease resistance protein [Arachis hypogaea]
MAEPVPFGIMERLIAELASPALDEIRLKDTLLLVKSVLLDAERKQENNRPLTMLTTSLMIFKPKSRETTSPVVADVNVIGREIDKEFIIDLLMQQNPEDDDERIPVIPIVGTGGVGKTTLAQLVFRDEREDTLAGQKFLLVLDNVWNEDRVKWMELRFLIEMRNKGGKFLLTTRSSKVASMMGTVNSMFLFLKCAFRNREEKKHSDLVMIEKEIVGKCKGLPLVIRALGSLLLSNRTKHEWESLRTSDIWNLESILPALKLSYDQMPTYLKQCFALFSLYPKGYIFLSSDVACLWGGSRFASTAKPRYFIQVVEDSGTFFYFQIHDLVHDLALLVARNECVLVSSDMQNISGNILHQSYIEDDLRGILFSRGIFRVRTILSPVHGVGAKDEVLLNAWISRYKSLRFLDLSDSTYETLPHSIAKLKHLRFLSLRNNTKIQTLNASICKLLNLQSLLLDGCTKLEILPQELRNSINLRQLGITTKQSVLPESDIAKLSSLEFLCIKKCDKLESLFVGRKLPNLRTLETLVINKCSDLEFSEEVQNSTLRLKVLYLHSLPQLVETLPSCFQGSASTLEALAIKECNRLESLPEWLSNPSSLKSLQITNCPNLKSLPSDLHRPALKSFQISDCPRLQTTHQLKM